MAAYLNNESYSAIPHFRIIPNIPAHIVMMFVNSHAWTSWGAGENTIVQGRHFWIVCSSNTPLSGSGSFPTGIMTIRIIRFDKLSPNPSSGVLVLVSMLFGNILKPWRTRMVTGTNLIQLQRILWLYSSLIMEGHGDPIEKNWMRMGDCRVLRGVFTRAEFACQPLCAGLQKLLNLLN